MKYKTDAPLPDVIQPQSCELTEVAAQIYSGSSFNTKSQRVKEEIFSYNFL